MHGFEFRGVRLFGLALALAIVGAREASAQVVHHAVNPYRMTYHPEHGYVPVVGGYGGFGGYGAVSPGMGAGVAMAGFGQAAAGVGQGRVYTAQAQDIHQQAVAGYLQNVGLAQDTALETSAKRDQATQQHREASDAHVREQVALYQKTLEQMSAAHRLTADQYGLDQDSTVLRWPFVLRGARYADLRTKLDLLYHGRTPGDSGENSSGFDGIQAACKQMQELVKAELKEGMPVNDYVTATHFISSVAYEARFSVKAAK
ncbi:MAG: hypothetical protein WD066_04060 [Planctomycetaceae bacterium]